MTSYINREGLVIVQDDGSYAINRGLELNILKLIFLW